jgi:hypothetical protein
MTRNEARKKLAAEKAAAKKAAETPKAEQPLYHISNNTFDMSSGFSATAETMAQALAFQAQANLETSKALGRLAKSIKSTNITAIKIVNGEEQDNE